MEEEGGSFILDLLLLLVLEDLLREVDLRFDCIVNYFTHVQGYRVAEE